MQVNYDTQSSETGSETEFDAPVPAAHHHQHGVPPEIVIAFENHHGLPHFENRELDVLNLNIAATWFDMAVDGTRTEDARRVCPYYNNRLADGRVWDLIKFTNGYAPDHFGNPPRVHWALWLDTRVVPSYHVVAPNGTVYSSNVPHYVIEFEQL
jgi:hypothetical protein